MKSLFHSSTLNEFVNRIEKLQPDSKAQWGKMRVEQMLAHCSIGLSVPLGEQQGTPGFVKGIFGRLIKPMVLGEKPFRKNSPTDPTFIVADERVFNKEKEELIKRIKRFSQAGESSFVGRVHPFFGKLTPREWNILMAKHLDHHLQQFGA